MRVGAAAAESRTLDPDARLQAMALASAAEPAEGLDSDDGASSGDDEEDGGRGGDQGAGPSEFESRKRAASTAMALGDGIGAEGRFRDRDFFINLARYVNPYTLHRQIYKALMRQGQGPPRQPGQARQPSGRGPLQALHCCEP